MDRKGWEAWNGHQGKIIWFTGLSGSGKTTIARRTEEVLLQDRLRCVVIDGDVLRSHLSRDLGFSENDRRENQRRASVVAELFLEKGFIVLVPMISPYLKDRALVRMRFHPEDYAELYVACSLPVCESRDPKGLYTKARSGELTKFTGIDAPYEPPIASELVLDTEHMTLDTCTTQLVNWIKMHCQSDL